MEEVALKLFIKGVDSFNRKKYYDSHEYFEDIWTNHTLDDRLFVQALIQLAVAYFHISNDNKNGALSLFNKTIKKIDNYTNRNELILNINDVIESTHKSYEYLQSIDDMNDFDWDLSPKLKINNKCNA